MTVLAASGLSPWYLLGGLAVALVVAVVQLTRPAAKSVIVATAQQAQAEAITQLARTEAMVSAIVENNMAAIEVVDLDGNRLLANEAWEREQLPAFDGDVTAPVREEIEVPVPHGPTRYLDTIRFPLRDEDGETYAVCTVALDVTDRREAVRELERSNSELVAFASAASHDLQEPLRTIVGFADVLERRYGAALDDTGRGLLERIRNSAARGSALIDDLLSVSRAGTETPAMETVALGTVAAEALDAVDDLRRRRSARIEIGDLPAVRGDATQLRRVLQNLLANAIKYVPADREPHVRVAARDEGEMVTVSVTDNGIGIAPEQRERVFEMFFRGDSAGSASGTGLGLAICQRVVERHGGRIWVEAADTGGSAFSFTLPAA